MKHLLVLFLVLIIVLTGCEIQIREKKEPVIPIDEKTTLSGTLEGENLHLTKEKSPYVVIGDVTVNSDDTLLIDPGVEIQVNGDFGFTVNGVIKAEGTSDERIKIYGINGGTNNLSKIFNLSGDENNKLSFIDISAVISGLTGYCNIENAKIEAVSDSLYAIGNEVEKLKGSLRDSVIKGKISLFEVTDIEGKKTLSGTLSSEDLHLTKENSPYVVIGDVTVNAGDTLLVDPGVELQVNGDYGFTINGVIKAEGTEIDKIKIYGINDGTYNLSSIMSLSNDKANKLSYVEIRGLKSGITGYASIENSRIEAASDSLYAIGNEVEKLKGSLRDSVIKGKISYLEVTEIEGKKTLSGTLSGEDLHLTKENSPYVVIGDVIVSESDTLFVDPGVEIQVNGDYGFSVNGLINAVGTETDKIKIYGINEGTNNLSRLMNLSDSEINKLSYVEIRGLKSGITGYANIENVRIEAIDDSHYAIGNEAEPFKGSLKTSDIIGKVALYKKVTELSGTLTGSNLHLTKLNSPYVLKGDVTVNEGDTLIVDPGVEIQVDGDYGFIVNGAIKAEGKATDRIKIYGINSGENNLSKIMKLSDNEANKLSFVEILGLKNGITGYCNIDNSIIEAVDDSYFALGNESEKMRGSLVRSNTLVKGKVSFIEVVPTTGKKRLGGALSGTNLHLTKEDSPYVVTRNVTIREGDTLIIDPGVEIQVNGDFGFTVNGVIKAEGTADERIKIYGINEGTDNISKILDLSDDKNNKITFADISGLTGGILGYCNIENSKIQAVNDSFYAIGNATVPMEGGLKESEVIGKIALYEGPIKLKGILKGENLHLTKDNEYIITGNVTVEASDTLIIDPGVKILVQGKAKTNLVIDGILKAEGTETERIQILGNNLGKPGYDLQNINCKNTSGESVLKYIDMQIQAGISGYCDISNAFIIATPTAISRVALKNFYGSVENSVIEGTISNVYSSANADYFSGRTISYKGNTIECLQLSLGDNDGNATFVFDNNTVSVGIMMLTTSGRFKITNSKFTTRPGDQKISVYGMSELDIDNCYFSSLDFVNKSSAGMANIDVKNTTFENANISLSNQGNNVSNKIESTEFINCNFVQLSSHVTNSNIIGNNADDKITVGSRVDSNTYNYTSCYFGEVFTEELKTSGTTEPSFISIDKTGSSTASVIISDYKESRIENIGFKETP